MAKVQILCWQEIPSIVEARDENGVKKIQLSERFQELIDSAAMKRKLAGTDAYLEEWNKTPTEDREGDASTVVEIVAAEIEEKFSDFRDNVLNLQS